MADDTGTFPTADGADYYIIDTRTVVGNCALWWCPDGKGYTCNLDDAGLYTRQQAKSHRETDVAVHREVAERLVVRHVRLDHLRQNVDFPTGKGGW